VLEGGGDLNRERWDVIDVVDEICGLLAAGNGNWAKRLTPAAQFLQSRTRWSGGPRGRTIPSGKAADLKLGLLKDRDRVSE